LKEEKLSLLTGAKRIKKLQKLITTKEGEWQDCVLHPDDYAVRLDGIEATQSVQNLDHSVPLFAHKRTVVLST
jgi:hypothetical protein